jgi:hypothetical protein
LRGAKPGPVRQLRRGNLAKYQTIPIKAVISTSGEISPLARNFWKLRAKNAWVNLTDYHLNIIILKLMKGNNELLDKRFVLINQFL